MAILKQIRMRTMGEHSGISFFSMTNTPGNRSLMKMGQVNEQIHYTGQCLANKSVYSQFLKSRNKGKFRQEHSSELALYETAVKFLKEKAGDGKLPNLQTLEAEKEKLLGQKKEAQEKYYYYRDYQKELDTVCANIHSVLGQQHNRPSHTLIPACPVLFQESFTQHFIGFCQIVFIDPQSSRYQRYQRSKKRGSPATPVNPSTLKIP